VCCWQEWRCQIFPPGHTFYNTLIISTHISSHTAKSYDDDDASDIASFLAVGSVPTCADGRKKIGIHRNNQQLLYTLQQQVVCCIIHSIWLLQWSPQDGLLLPMFEELLRKLINLSNEFSCMKSMLTMACAAVDPSVRHLSTLHILATCSTYACYCVHGASASPQSLKEDDCRDYAHVCLSFSTVLRNKCVVWLLRSKVSIVVVV